MFTATFIVRGHRVVTKAYKTEKNLYKHAIPANCRALRVRRVPTTV